MQKCTVYIQIHFFFGQKKPLIGFMFSDVCATQLPGRSWEERGECLLPSRAEVDSFFWDNLVHFSSSRGNNFLVLRSYSFY